MSEEDQVMIVGRLTIERSQAKREQRLIGEALNLFAENLEKLAEICRNPEDSRITASAMAALDRLSKNGGILDIRKALDEFNLSAQKVRSLDERLRGAGIDLSL
jgi:hypothetical protein